jgi:hypothetical protein
MIEFKGAFYKSKTSPSQLVLVQFDGVLLHIWNISSPFHRILSSDAFRLPFTLGQQRRWVKLPNGIRIETDDIQALNLLKSSCRSNLAVRIRLCMVQWNASVVFSALVAALTFGLLAAWFSVVNR